MTEKISSGSKVIDSLLAGGFERGIITTLYGAASSGKSNITMLATVSIASQGKKVLFIDTEGGFSIERIQQIAQKDCKPILKNILLLEPTNFEEQKKALGQVAEIVGNEKIGLVIVDSIAMLYRLQKGSQEEIAITNKELACQLSVLSEVARKMNIPCLVTNQVYADFQNKNNVHMVGGDLLKYWSKCIIKLEILENGVRKASIFKARSLPEGKCVFFEIEEKGLAEREAPKEKKKFSLF